MQRLPDLSGKRVLLGVSGSISAYKACEVARLFIKAGASVQVVMTPAAERFVSALTFEALTRNAVLTEKSESWSGTLNHIDAGKAADLMLIAPATANTLNKLSKGIADNIMLQCALAFKGPLVVAPAANTQMLANHYTQGSIKMLRVNDIEVIEPQHKRLACGDEGNGALAEPLDIFYSGARAMLREAFWEDRRVVVTGGGTREALDGVRYLGNRSSGKMAKAIATALYLRGADVCYIGTTGFEGLPGEIYTLDVENSDEMYEYTVDAVRVAKKGKMSKASMNSDTPIHLIQKTPYLFMVAAVSDYKAKYPQEGKLKKSALGEVWQPELTQTVDILKSINKEGIVTVGFKAESNPDTALQEAKRALKSKGADAICLNIVSGEIGFGSDDNAVTLVTATDTVTIEQKPKTELAFDILEQVKGLDDA